MFGEVQSISGDDPNESNTWVRAPSNRKEVLTMVLLFLNRFAFEVCITFRLMLDSGGGKKSFKVAEVSRSCRFRNLALPHRRPPSFLERVTTVEDEVK